MRVELVNRIEGGAARAGGVQLPLTLGVATAPAVVFKQVDRIEGGTAGAGSAPLSSAYCPFFILAQY
ncbi:hypothetical protein E1189_02185 [Sansalvadorimonas verongulae]|nr:hypothetical protein [Sansalvadorimonas verongulae]